LSGIILLVSSIVPLDVLPLVPCWFKRITGWPCLFCGMTRAFTAIGHGRVGAGIAESPAGALLYALVAATFAINAYALLARRRIGWTLPKWLKGRTLAWSTAVLLLANWLYRISAGLK
jgi:hypothetical protein